METNVIYNEDCLKGMKKLPDKSIDAIVTDPPYLYLKHKLDRDFDEDAVFQEWDRVLKDSGMICIFGRGESFYRWGTKLAGLGFKFKEEIIWDKRYSSSPVTPIKRVHESIAVFSKNGKIRNIRVDYLEASKYDLQQIQSTLNRIASGLGNEQSFADMKEFLDTKQLRYRTSHTDKHAITITNKYKDADRSAVSLSSIVLGKKERSIITVPREHFKAVHPTQKPVKLMERLINLVSDKGDLILDPFLGSASTVLAASNTERDYIGYEIDEEYFEIATNRIDNHTQQLNLFG